MLDTRCMMPTGVSLLAHLCICTVHLLDMHNILSVHVSVTGPKLDKKSLARLYTCICL